MAEKHGALALRFSQPIRDTLNRLHVEQNRENMATLSLYLRKAFGEDVLSKVILADAKNNPKDIVVVDGVRRLSDIIHMETDEHFYFAYMDTASEKRYERLIQRRQNIDDATKTPAQFEKDAKRETELQISGLRERADFVISNDGTLDELYTQVDSMVEELRKRSQV
jgi:uridine kinase